MIVEFDTANYSTTYEYLTIPYLLNLSLKFNESDLILTKDIGSTMEVS